MTVGTLRQAQHQQGQIVDLRPRRRTQQGPQMLRQMQIQSMMVYGTLLPMQIVSRQLNKPHLRSVRTFNSGYPRN
jgi:hypothetical protein